ncbi:hypothetical protein O4H52_21480, partial [Sphingomonadaceae bacterium G21617-S1]|nr:hypothetical protein [Sphingomonadaceae bacterium G21617-S1]
HCVWGPPTCQQKEPFNATLTRPGSYKPDILSLLAAIHIGFAILLALLALLALLILALTLELFFADLILTTNRILILAQVALLGAVTAALPILGHGIFSCDRPGEGTGREPITPGAVPIVSAKSLKRR